MADSWDQRNGAYFCFKCGAVGVVKEILNVFHPEALENLLVVITLTASRVSIIATLDKDVIVCEVLNRRVEGDLGLGQEGGVIVDDGKGTKTGSNDALVVSPRSLTIVLAITVQAIVVETLRVTHVGAIQPSPSVLCICLEIGSESTKVAVSASQ